MTTTTTTTTTTKSEAIRWAIFSAVAVGLTALGLGIAQANPPQQDQPCSMRHAALRDADGHMMTCDRMMNGNHGLVWQYALGS
jgi:uncharacterized protein involved in copper resistance